MRRRSRAAVAAFLVVAAVTVAYVVTVPAIGTDAALGLLATEQRLLGRSPSLDQVTLVDTRDLRRDATTRITWWNHADAEIISAERTKISPAHHILIYGLRVTGLRLGSSVRLLSIVCWLIGITAWARYFLRVSGANAVGWSVLGAFALHRMSHINSHTYLGGETLLWMVFPLAVLANLNAVDARRRQGAWRVVAGALSFLCVVCKPSGGILFIAVACWWLLRWRRAQSVAGDVMQWSIGAAVMGVVSAAAGLAPRDLSNLPNNVDLCSVDPLAAMGWATGGWLVGATDLAAAIESAGRVIPTVTGLPALAEFWLSDLGSAAIAVALTVLFAAWWTRLRLDKSKRHVSDVYKSARSLATTTIVVVAIGILALQLRGACVSFEGRHAQYGAFLALPLLATLLARQWLTSTATDRWWPIVMALTLFGAPALYGTGSFVDNVVVGARAREAAIGGDGLRRNWLPPTASADLVDRRYLELVGMHRVLVTQSAVAALSFPAHRLLIPPQPVASAAPPEGIAILPGGAENSDPRVHEMFPRVPSWENRELVTGVNVVMSRPR